MTPKLRVIFRVLGVLLINGAILLGTVSWLTSRARPIEHDKVLEELRAGGAVVENYHLLLDHADEKTSSGQKPPSRHLLTMVSCGAMFTLGLCAILATRGRTARNSGKSSAVQQDKT